MLRRTLPIMTFALLSGCAMLQPHDPAPTLNAVSSLQNNVSNKLSTMAGQIQQQNSLITELQQTISSMTSEIKQHNKLAAKAPKVIIQEKTIKVPVPAAAAPVDPTIAHGKSILGEQEWVWLNAIQSHFKARIDTGATTSSLDAQNLQIFERNGKDWARFNLVHDIDPNNPLIDTIETPVTRWVKIRQASTDGTERRAVVELMVGLGKIHENTEFTLADRSQMTYPVLLGRNFFRDIALVDVAQKYVQGKNSNLNPNTIQTTVSELEQSATTEKQTLQNSLNNVTTNEATSPTNMATNNVKSTSS